MILLHLHSFFCTYSHRHDNHSCIFIYERHSNSLCRHHKVQMDMWFVRSTPYSSAVGIYPTTCSVIPSPGRTRSFIRNTSDTSTIRVFPTACSIVPQSCWASTFVWMYVDMGIAVTLEKNNVQECVKIFSYISVLFTQVSVCDLSNTRWDPLNFPSPNTDTID